MKNLIDMYLDYLNNFLTVEKFAEYYDLEKQDAFKVIELGRKYHELKVERYKNNINVYRLIKEL